MEYDFYPFTYPHEKWVYKNRCVIKIEHKMPEGLPPDLIEMHRRFMPESHLCGYVILPKNSVPKDWWGSYDAPGLNSLAIHGNITYCELEGVPDQENISKRYRDAIANFYAEWEKDKGSDPMQYIEKKMAIKKAYVADLSVSPEGFVVFGFDCNHHGDAQNPAVHRR
jgi:hypothetical protein